MNNFIKYFYNINTDNIINKDKYYEFNYNNSLYRLYILEDIKNIEKSYYISNNIKNISKIILNINKEIITIYNNINYILLEIYLYNKDIILEDIYNLSKYIYNDNININWGILWEKKIDYLEDIIYENGLKYPLLVDSFNYFVGMAENAISYYYNYNNSVNIYTISHKHIRVNDKIDELYNPMNIIIDYRVRDIAEYIKISFFKNKNILEELNTYLNKYNLSRDEAILLVSRILYPSFYFDMYEDILIDNKEEKIILDIILRIDEYEKYIGNIISILSIRYDIPNVEWLKK